MDGAEPHTPAEGEPLIGESTPDHPLYDSVVEACRSVHDPEIPVNIYDLGLIYRIAIDAEAKEIEKKSLSSAEKLKAKAEAK